MSIVNQNLFLYFSDESTSRHVSDWLAQHSDFLYRTKFLEKTVFLILKIFQTRLFQPQLKKVKLLHKNLLKTSKIRSLTFFILLTVQLSQATINQLDQLTNFYRSLTFSIPLRSGFATNSPAIAKVIAHFIGSLTSSTAEHADSTTVPHAPLQTNLYPPRFFSFNHFCTIQPAQIFHFPHIFTTLLVKSIIYYLVNTSLLV